MSTHRWGDYFSALLVTILAVDILMFANLIGKRIQLHLELIWNSLIMNEVVVNICQFLADQHLSPIILLFRHPRMVLGRTAPFCVFGIGGKVQISPWKLWGPIWRRVSWIINSVMDADAWRRNPRDRALAEATALTVAAAICVSGTHSVTLQWFLPHSAPEHCGHGLDWNISCIALSPR